MGPGQKVRRKAAEKRGPWLLRILTLLSVATIGLLLWWNIPNGPNGHLPGAGNEDDGNPADRAARPSPGQSESTNGTHGSRIIDSAGGLTGPEISYAKDESQSVSQGRVSSEGEITVTGVVRSAVDQSLLPEVIVQLEVPDSPGSSSESEIQTVTNAAGEFRLEWGRGELADLTLQARGYGTTRLPNLDLSGTLDLELRPAGSIRGQVFGARSALARMEDSTSAALAVAWLANTSGKRFWQRLETPLEEGGVFSFEELQEGQYVVTAELEGLSVQVLAGVAVGPGEEVSVALEAVPGAILSGRVLEQTPGQAESARPLPGVLVTLTVQEKVLPNDADSSADRETISDADGAFLFEGLDPGGYLLRATFPGGKRVRRKVTMPSSREALVQDIIHVPTGSLSGILVNGSGAPVASMGLRVFEATDGQRWNQLGTRSLEESVVRGMTDQKGQFQLEQVPTRVPLILAVLSTDPRDALLPQQVAPTTLSIMPLTVGEARSGQRLVLPNLYSLSGHVVGPDGDGLPSAQVLHYRQLAADSKAKPSILGTLQCDAEGMFTLGGLLGGELQLELSAPGFLAQRFNFRHTSQIPSGPFVFALQPSLGLNGLATDEDGAALAGLPIRIALRLDLLPPGDIDIWNLKQSTRTDRFGRFRFDGLFEGGWDVSGGSFQWEFLSSSPEVCNPADSTSVELTFAPRNRRERFTIKGQVESVEALELDGIKVTGQVGGALYLDGGRFVASGLTPTRQKLVVHAAGHRRRVLPPIDPRPGGEVSLGRIILETSCAVTVHVVNARGKPVEEAEVTLAPLGPGEGGPVDQARIRLTHKGKGRYRGAEAERARYRVVVKSKGSETQRQDINLAGRAEFRRKIRL